MPMTLEQAIIEAQNIKSEIGDLQERLSAVQEANLSEEEKAAVEAAYNSLESAYMKLGHSFS